MNDENNNVISNTGIRYCPNCGKPDRCDWNTYEDTIQKQWITPDSEWYCSHCNSGYTMDIWYQQTTPFHKIDTSIKQDESDSRFIFAYVCFIIISLLALVFGFYTGVRAQIEQRNFPFVKHPIYQSEFSFDKIELLDNYIRSLDYRLNNARQTQIKWIEKANDILRSPKASEGIWIPADPMQPIQHYRVDK